MKQKIYQVDAFAKQIFSGNPAAVCPLDKWLPDQLMQKIAMENNLAETAFYVKEGDQFTIRWFTPAVEVDLCGHATLAAAFVLFDKEGYEGDTINFHSPRGGPLTVSKNQNLLSLNFPADIIEPAHLTTDLKALFNQQPQEVFKGKTDYMFVFENETEIKNCKPDLAKVAGLDVRGIIITAPGYSTDFVSRFFAPRVGINEDPVTGSAHTTLTPYWAGRLNKNDLSAIQLSERKGYLQCTLSGDRVEISGEARLYMTGEIEVS